MDGPMTTQWDDELLQSPHAAPDKRLRVQKMFAAIAPSYDLNNRLHSLWMDQAWRRKAVKLAGVKPNDSIVDVACGTGDLSLKFAKTLWDCQPGTWGEIIVPEQPVIGIDFT